MTERILITGATSGIGRQLTIDYLKDNHTVYAVGRDITLLNELKVLGATPINVDLTDHKQVKQKLEAIGSLDVVICCAGVCEYIDITTKNSLADDGNFGFNAATVMKNINVNLSILVYTIETVLPALKKSQGRLVALGSASAFVPFPRAEGYGSSKSAIHYLMQTLQISLKPLGVNVSLVIPGFVETPMTDQNDFIMPFFQTTEQASRAIRHGIDKGQDIIAFPKKLTTPLKTLGMLPNGVWRFVSNKLNKKQ